MICASEPPGTYPLTFLVKGIEPDGYEWESALPSEKKRFWEIAGIIAEKVKQKELQQGLDRHGRKLRPVKYRKVKFRRSGRIVDGEPLMPHRALARTRRLLKYTITSIGVLFYWQNGWAKILDYHRRGACLKRNGRIVGKLPVRDVFGISPTGIKEIQREAISHWRRGTMPKKKIDPIMSDEGLSIELPMDSGTDKQTGEKIKPLTEWSAEDFLAAGVKVTRFEGQNRTVNTATGTPGLMRTGMRVQVDWNQDLPWKSALNRKKR